VRCRPLAWQNCHCAVPGRHQSGKAATKETKKICRKERKVRKINNRGQGISSRKSCALSFRPKGEIFLRSLALWRDDGRWITERLKVSDPATIESGYDDIPAEHKREPYPSADGLRVFQRIMKGQSPEVAQVRVEDLVDDRIVRRLDGRAASSPKRTIMALDDKAR
jgi:hypothetical protein